MKRLGYTRYVAQGGDWGAGIVQAMGRQAPAGLLGIHTNLPATVPNEVGAALGGGPAAGRALRRGTRGRRCAEGVRPERRPGLRGDDERAAAGRRLRHDGLARRPRGVDARAPGVRALVVRQGSQAVADARRRAGQLHAVLADEQRGLVGEDLLGEPRAEPHQCGARRRPTRSRSRWPSPCFRTRSIAPRRRWARRAFPNLIYFHEADRGGHFAAWEYPELFAAELRAAFRSLRPRS